MALYVGAVIGAGFASGQEIMQFFGHFGYWGLWGIITATALFAYLGAVVQVTAVNLRSSNYREVLDYFLGSRLAKAMDIFSMLMLLGCLGVMLAGSGAIFEEQMGWPSAAGVVFLALLIIVILWFGLTGVVAANVVLVPLKLLVVCGVAILSLMMVPDVLPTAEMAAENHITGNWIWAATLYVSYNIILSLAVLSSLGRHISRKEAVIGGFAGGLAIGLAATAVTTAIITYYSVVINYQVPLLYLAGVVHPAIRFIVSLVIWLAMVTTAIANAHGFASRLAKSDERRYRLVGAAACLGMTPVCLFDFSSVVQSVYPLFGLLGLILMGALILKPVIGIWRRKAKKVEL
ncbi:MAG: hypothetical protein H0Z39_01455 [Peptococcaceae bacterium]|nr:hypothetical protein [Peptococcaceae bacterium]